MNEPVTVRSMLRSAVPEDGHALQLAGSHHLSALETALGDPLAAEGCSFHSALQDDEVERFPEQLCAAITHWGLHRHYVPSRCGGQFASFEVLMRLVGVVARRDLTAAIAHSAIYLGAACVWMRGTAAQQAQLAALILRGEAVAFGLTERGHGSDILASETSATRVEGGYVLSGEKWLINNATRAAAIMVFARTHEAGGPRGFSLFMLSKRELAADAYRHLPRVKTLGLRGADISGIAFERCFVPADCMVGTAGEGLDLVLKTLQVTRTLCVGLSLGAADTALRSALQFATTRVLYGRKIIDIPAVRRTLVIAFIDILICDCLAMVVARGLHVVPEQFSVWSAVVKYFVPVTIDAVIRELATLMGASGYLRDGIFQKVQRDHSIVGIFDGNTAVNLQAIALQLPSLLSRAESAAGVERAPSIFTLDEVLPPFDAERLALFNHGRDSLLQSLLTCEAALKQMGGEVRVLTLVSQARRRLESLRTAVIALSTQRGSMLEKSAVMSDLAKEYCLCVAVSACVQIWRYNQARLALSFAGSEWLTLALERLLGCGMQPQSQQLADGCWRSMMDSYERDLSFSLAPFKYSRK